MKKSTGITAFWTMMLISTFAFGQIKPNASTQGVKTPTLPTTSFSNTEKVSFVRTYDLYAPFIEFPTSSTTITFNTAISAGNIMQTTQYVDGLGRPVQTVARRALPGGYDLVQYMPYDAYGRQVYQPMAFQSDLSTGQMHLSPSSRLDVFMNGNGQPTSGFYPSEDIFYGKTEFEASPLNRVTKQMAPGNSWAGSGVGISSSWRTNNSDDAVRRWVPGTSSASSPGVYADEELMVTITTDEEQNQVREFTDKLGRVVLKRVQKNVSTADSRTNWLSTYYVYDNYGNLRFVLPPRAEEVLSSGNFLTWNTNDMNALAFHYTYDTRNRMITKRVPGGEWVDMVYDKLDRLVATQDGNLREQDKWLITKYDVHNRPVITGLYEDTSDRNALQTIVDSWNNDIFVRTEAPNATNVVEGVNITISQHISGTVEYRVKNGGTITFLPGFDSGTDEFQTTYYASLSHEYTFYQGYYDASFPTIDNDVEVLTIGYFDNYEFTSEVYDSGQEIGFHTAGTNNAVNPAAYTDAKGLATGSKVKILGSTDDWLTTVMFYDDRGRLIQTVADNHLGGKDISTTQYDFSGKVLNTYMVHNNPEANGSDAQTTIAKRYSYESSGTGRLTKIEQRLNNTGSYKAITTNSYDDLGQLESKKLNDATSPLETLNFDYTVRGWLKGINTAYATSGTGSHYFGMDLSYDFGFTQNQLNGNIAGIKWRSKSSGETKAYGFEYDQSNRLLKADYTEGTSWVSTENDFSTTYSYDVNGNILTLSRKGVVAGSLQTLDNLQFNYGQGLGLAGKKNQLIEVKDLAGDFGQGDFVDGNTGTDYSYDLNGNLTQDLNKGISAGNITYNHLNLPQTITFSGNRSITYTYDAAGIKLSKTVNNNGAISTTDYVSGFIYENDQLQHFAHEEGRVRKNYQGNLIYDYFVKDHLGNTRVTLTEEEITSTYLATMETEYRAFETDESQGLGFRNINTSNTEVNPTANTTVDQFNELDSPSPNMVLRTNGSYTNLKIGASKMIKVMPDDVVSVTASATTGSVDNGGSAAAITAALVSQAFGGSTSSSGGAEGAIFDLFNNNFSNILTYFGPQDGNATDAYLNWILFDEDFGVVNSGTGFDQVSDNASKETLSSGNITVTSSGYFYIFVSNEGTETVYFDDVRLEHTTGNILQEDHYYPFGANISALSSTAPLSKPNKYKFNGNEEQTEFDLNLHDFNARFYDPVLGRFTSVDPLADDRVQVDLTPYQFGWNNPILYNDPFGLCPECEERVTDPTDGQEYISTAGEVYKYENGSWVRQDGDIGEFVVTAEKETEQGNTEATIAPPLQLPPLTGPMAVPKVHPVILAPVAIERGWNYGKELGKAENWDPMIEKIAQYLERLGVPSEKLRGPTVVSYIPPPKTLPGFPNAQRVKSKNQRARWKDSNGDILEWDYQEGHVEVYNKRGTVHKGAYDPDTGEQIKPGESGRTTDN